MPRLRPRLLEFLSDDLPEVRPLSGAWTWADAYRHDLATLNGANVALRVEISAAKHYPAEAWLPGALHLAVELERAGYWWQARTLRAHVARISGTRPRYAGRLLG